MTKEQIRAVLDRVLTWPADAQAEAVASLEAIEEEFLAVRDLSDGDHEALVRSAEDMRLGRFASDPEVREVFARFRRS